MAGSFMGIENVKLFLLILCIASGLHPLHCYDCRYKFTKPSTCLGESEQRDLTITCYLDGPQNENPITVTWYKRNGETLNWHPVELEPNKFENPYYSGDLGNGTKEVVASLKILSVSEMDVGCYACEACVTYIYCTPPDWDEVDSRCLRGGEQCIARHDVPLCSAGSTDYGRPLPNKVTSLMTRPRPTDNLNKGGGAISGSEMALYGGIAVCLVLAVTSLLLIIVVIVLCANKNGSRKRRGGNAGGRTRAAVVTGNSNSVGGILSTLTNVDSDAGGTMSSSGTSSSGGTLLTIPSFNGTLTPCPNAPATSCSVLFVPPNSPRSRHLSPAQSPVSSGGPNPVHSFIPNEHHPHHQPPQNSYDSNPKSLKCAEPQPSLKSPASSILSSAAGMGHHYHVLELRPVSEVGSDTTTAQTREDSWSTIGPLPVARQAHHKAVLQLLPGEMSAGSRSKCAAQSPASTSMIPEGVLTPVESPAPPVSDRYKKLEVSTLGPKHEYTQRSVGQTEPPDVDKAHACSDPH